MILKKLQIENLRSYEKQKVEFPKGSTLLSGDIGSGKTTILLAIEFALFGLQPSQKGSSLLRTGKDNAKVILEFEIEGKNIIIERALKKGKKSISQDYATIIIDNEKFEGSITEVKNKVLKLLNYPPEFTKKTNLLYKFTVYTPQEEMKQIILEPGDIRLNTLRHVFGIDKYKRIKENADILTSKLREKTRINEAIIYDLKEYKQGLKQKKQDLINLKQKKQESIKEHETAKEFSIVKEKLLEEIKEKINEKKTFENEKKISDILVSEKTQQMNTLENNLKTLKLQIEEARKISFSKQDFDSLNQRIEFQQNKQEDLQKEYIQIISKINAGESKKTETESLKNKISKIENCPTCLQKVSEEYKSNIFTRANQEIQEIQNNLDNLLPKKQEITNQINISKKTLEDFKKKKSELDILKIKSENLQEKEQRIDEIEKQKQAISKDLEMLEKHIKTTEKSISEYLKYDKIFEQRDKELKDAKQKENNAAIRKAEANKEIQFAEKQINEKQEQVKEKEKIKQRNEKIKEVEYWISEKFLNLILFTERQVMLTLKQEFSELFSKWFAILVSDSLSAKLDEEFSPIIEQQDYELDYSFLSGGERTAIALAYRLSLNQVINSLLSNIKTRNLVILDEPTDGFSAQQLDKMRDVLGQLNTEQLILVSHEPKIEGFVDNIIRFTKEGGITKVEE